MHHPDGLRVDVVGFLVQPAADWQNRAVNDGSLEGLGDFSVTAGMDAFVLGYPLDPEREGAAWLPIWKRATIASEPAHGGRTVLVDSTTRPGMSGGPVFARSMEATAYFDFTTLNYRYRFIGIYTNRIMHDDHLFRAQIGTVFKYTAIEEMLRAMLYFKPA